MNQTLGLALSASLASPEEDVLGVLLLLILAQEKSDFIDAMEGKSWQKPNLGSEVRRVDEKRCV